MKKHSYGKLISMSWGWTLEMLFRPFNLKKWIMLGIILILAGQMGGSFNINLPANKVGLNQLIRSSQAASIEEGKITLPSTALQNDIRSQLRSFFSKPETKAITAVFISFILLLIGIFIPLWMWVSSNFTFVFIDSIIRNDASLRVPFHRNKTPSNSYFKWNLTVCSIALLLFGGIIFLPAVQLIRSGVFSSPPSGDIGRILSIVLPYVPVLLIVSIIFFLVAFFTLNFVLPVMYKKKIGILKSWGIFLALLKKNIGEMLLYILVKIALSILAAIAAAIAGIIGIIALLLIGLLIGLLGVLIHTLTPAAAKGVVTILLAAVGIPVFVFLGFLFNLIFLPIPVFFRTFSIHVLGSIDESLDLFAPKTPEELTAEGEDAQYRKSMGLVWFTALLPILIALTAIIFAIALPNFVKGRHKAWQMRQQDFKKMMPLQKSPTKPVFPSEKEVKTVMVYLKNGRSFKAEIERESERNIEFKVEGGTFIIPRGDILRIEE